MRVWDITTGRVEHTLARGHSGIISAVVFSHDGGKLASGSHDDTVRVWDIATEEVEYTLEGHSGWVSSVVFSHDGSKLASGSSDCTVLVWDVRTEKIEHVLLDHLGWVDSIVFLPDGSKLISGSRDHTLRLWDIATEQVERTLEGHSGTVSSLMCWHDESKAVLCKPETIHHRVEPRPIYSVDKSGDWVTQNGSRILTLPIDHRPGCMATKGNNLAIGSSTGRVTIITFYSDVKA